MVPAPMAPLNGNSKGDRVSCLIDEILACCADLSEFPDLKPCVKVNKTFEKLVGLCSQCPGEDVVTKVCSSGLSFSSSSACRGQDLFQMLTPWC